MAKMDKNEKMVFKHYYDSLTEEERIELRNKFLEASGLAYTSFYYKLRNKKFTKLEQLAIETFCKEKFNWA